MSDASTNKAPVSYLHVCPDCGSTLVQPTFWEQAEARGHWRVWRRCPECDWRNDGVHGEVEIDAFDEQLDLGSQELADELRALEHSNMAHMAESFVVALESDLIGADDFA
ncbi:MAG TPA: hypothetical protein VNB59_00580 [Solirubrobacterales bacterium]|jgi:hypothetical protein|nr:hypothetical protein [Solirubrobacterales bacterium]